MSNTEILTMTFPVVVAILTIYFNNFFQEKSKNKEQYRNKKHEHLPYIYKEISLIKRELLNTHGTFIAPEYSFPSEGTSIEGLRKYLEGLNFTKYNISTIIKLLQEDYDDAKIRYEIIFSEYEVKKLKTRIINLREYWLSVSLYLKHEINTDINAISELMAETVLNELSLIWSKNKERNEERFERYLDNRIRCTDNLRERTDLFYVKARKYLKKY